MVCVLCLFQTVPLFGLRSVIVPISVLKNVCFDESSTMALKVTRDVGSLVANALWHIISRIQRTF